MRRRAAARLRRQYILLHALHHQQPAVQVSSLPYLPIYEAFRLAFVNRLPWQLIADRNE